MSHRHLLVGFSALVLAIACCAIVIAQAADQPETVMITFRAKPGAEEQLASVIARHYDTAKRLHLLRDDAPHVTVRVPDEGNSSYFVDIFTWRDGSVPDNAPKEILAIWQEMNRLTEKRGGHPGVDIVEVRILNSKF